MAAGLILGGVFRTSDELLENKDRAIPDPPAVVEMLEAQSNPDDGDGAATQTEEKKKSLRERIRCAVLRLPLWLRTVICLPLWCAGQIVIFATGLLWDTILSPVLKTLLPWISFALITALVAAVVLKLLFPQLKAKEIFGKRNLIILITGTALTAMVNLWLKASDAADWTQMLAKTIGSTMILAAVVLPLIFRYVKDSKKPGILPVGG